MAGRASGQQAELTEKGTLGVVRQNKNHHGDHMKFILKKLEPSEQESVNRNGPRKSCVIEVLHEWGWAEPLNGSSINSKKLVSIWDLETKRTATTGAQVVRMGEQESAWGSGFAGSLRSQDSGGC